MKSKLIAIVAAVVLVGVWLLMPPPIHRAAIRGNIEAVKQYLDGGTEVNAKMKDGDTPLDSAEYVHESDHSPVERATKKETANLLRKHGGKTAEELKAIGN